MGFLTPIFAFFVAKQEDKFLTALNLEGKSVKCELLSCFSARTQLPILYIEHCVCNVSVRAE